MLGPVAIRRRSPVRSVMVPLMAGGKGVMSEIISPATMGAAAGWDAAVRPAGHGRVTPSCVGALFINRIPCAAGGNHPTGAAMRLSRKNVFRLLAAGAVTIVAAFMYGGNADSTRAACDQAPCHNCPHLVCVSACWADGFTYDPSSCTDVKHTIPAPVECADGGGCRTIACN